MNCLRPNLEPGLPHSIISFATLVTIMDPLPRAWLPAGTKPRAFSYSSTSYYHQNQNQSPLTTATKTHIHTTKRTLMPVVVSRKTEPWVGNSRTMKLKPQTFWSHLHQPQHLSGILQGRVFPFSIKGLVHIQTQSMRLPEQIPLSACVKSSQIHSYTTLGFSTSCYPEAKSSLR